MKFKYRFKGKVNSQFILRGFLFKVGSKIDFCISENELEFVKNHCEIIDIIDREQKPAIEIPETMLEQELENKPKGENENVELHKSNTSRKTKVKISG